MPSRSMGTTAKKEELIDLTNNATYPMTTTTTTRDLTNDNEEEGMDETRAAVYSHTTATAAAADEDDEDDYVPPGLADFVSLVHRNLEVTQHEFFNVVPSGRSDDTDNDTLPTLLSMTHLNLMSSTTLMTTTTQSYDEIDGSSQRIKAAAAAASLLDPTTATTIRQPFLTEDDQLYRNQILQCNSAVGGGVLGLSTAAVSGPTQTPSAWETRPGASAGAMDAATATTLTTLMSPDDLLVSPPPNPVWTMTDTEIQRQALGDQFRSPPPPPTVLFGSPPPQLLAANEASQDGHHDHYHTTPPNHPTVSQATAAVAAVASATPPHSAITTTTTPTSHSLLGVQLVSHPSSPYEQQQQQAGPLEIALNMAAQSTVPLTNVVDANPDSTLLPDQKNLMEFLSSIDQSTSKDTSQSPISNGVVIVREPNRIDTTEVSVPVSSSTPVKGLNVSQSHDETATPSPLSMSSPSKSSTQARQQKQAFTEQLRTNPRLRVSSPVYGLAPAPEEQLTLAQRLASDAERYGLPPPTPDTTVTGPPAPPPASSSLTTVIQPHAISFQSIQKSEPVAKDLYPATMATRHTNAKPLPLSSDVTTSGRITLTRPQLSIVTTPSPPLTLVRSNDTTSKPTSASKSVSTGTYMRDSPPLSTAGNQKAISPPAVQSDSMTPSGQQPSFTTSSKGKTAPPKSQQTEQSRTTPRMPSPIAELLNKPSLVKSTRSTDRVVSKGSAKSSKPSPPQISSQHPPGVSKPIATPSSLKATNILSTPSPLSMASHGHEPPSAKNNAAPQGPTNPCLGRDDGPMYTVETPSPLSMSSPKFESLSRRIHEATSNNSSASTTSLPPPRFSPPSPRRVKTAARFTAETANRLAKPVVKTPPPSDLAPQSIKLQGSARFTSDSANRLSATKTKSPTPPLFSNSATQGSLSKATPSITSQSVKPLSTPHSPVVSRPSSQKVLHRPLATTPARPVAATSSQNSKIAALAILEGDVPTSRQEALARTIAFATNGHQNPVSPPVIQSSPRRFENTARHSSQRSTATESQVHLGERDNARETSSFPLSSKAESPLRLNATSNGKPNYRLPDPALSSPVVFTAETADRLMRPTVARNLAIVALIPRHKWSDTGVMVLDGGPKKVDGNEIHEAHNFRVAQSSPIPETSHLLLNTAVSAAKKTTPIKPTVRLPPPRRFVSGVSERLMTRTAANQALIDDGSIRAKERVQKRQLERLVRTATSPVSRHQRKVFTAEDGIVKMRERMHRAQQKKLQLLGKQSVMDVKISVPENAKRSDLFGSSMTGEPAVKRILTVPQAPKFATSARRGDRPPMGRTEVQTLAQSVIVFGKGLRDDISGSGSAGSHGSSQRSLTIPNAFKLATDILLGEKSKPPRSRADVSLAQSSNVLRDGLRAPYYPLSTVKTTGPTIPHSPKFQTMSNRELPKSSVEKEAEEMAFFKAHPFKATSTPRDGPKRSFTEHNSSNEGLPSFMRPTKGQFERASKLPMQIKIKVVSTSGASRVSLAPPREGTRPFKARPAPLSTRQPPTPVSPSSLQVTKPIDRGVPAAMTETSRRRADELAQERDRRKSASKAESSTVPARRMTLTEPRPFSFATSTRMDRSAVLIRQEIN